MPGSTPIICPSSTPAKHISRFIGVAAVMNPCIRSASGPMIRIPSGPMGKVTFSQVRKIRNRTAVVLAATNTEGRMASRSTNTNKNSSIRNIAGPKPIGSNPAIAAAKTASTMSGLPIGSSGLASLSRKRLIRTTQVSPIRMTPYHSGMKPDCGAKPSHNGMRIAAPTQSRPSATKKAASTSSPIAIRPCIATAYFFSRSR